MKDNRAFVVTGLGAAILDAETEINIKTKGKVPLRYYKTMNWKVLL